jgi:hypothetical protein
LTTSNSTGTIFPPKWKIKEEMRPCGLNDCPLNAIKRVGYGVSSWEPIYFQQHNDIMLVKAPSSMTILPIMCFSYTTIIWKAT